MASTMNPLKIEVGISMLAETRDWEFAAAHALLKKILGNVLANPAEPKFRTLRTSNAKLAPLFATRGVKALLRGAGFAEEADFLSLDAAAPTDGVHLALSQLEAHAVARAERAEAAKVQEASERKAMAEEGQEKRKLMRTQIEEDAAARKEPGWTAKAAGVKGGKAITSCADIGAQGGGG
ncbi:hypothetical protein AB1Y20_002377 [Prymnesium parvum]|uniref:PUB domain-containing protein n=1 Tax=Prymnesium parvum TaxID=97485 RepID=A0AB34JAY1_PRYPA